jgi:hypothetical protein
VGRACVVFLFRFYAAAQSLAFVADRATALPRPRVALPESVLNGQRVIGIRNTSMASGIALHARCMCVPQD